MDKGIGKILLQQSPLVKWLLASIVAILTGIAAWGFIIDIQVSHSLKSALTGIPTQLQVMWTSALGLLTMGIDKLESKLNMDIDGDGDIGGAAANNAPTAPVEVAQVEVVADAECDAKLYTV